MIKLEKYDPSLLFEENFKVFRLWVLLHLKDLFDSFQRSQEAIQLKQIVARNEIFIGRLVQVNNNILCEKTSEWSL